MNGEFPADARQAYPADLANRLAGLGYIGLFQQSDEAALADIWNTPGAPEALETLALSPDAPMPARFLAAELLFYKGGIHRAEEHKQQLARVYAAALADNFTETANPWGLPGVLDGLAAEHLLAIGEPMVPELLNLLDNDKRVYYEGSEEATLGHLYGYRVKDLAAYHIGKIRNTPLKLDEDPSRRDETIEKLKNAVK
jgi:hypothetical protein